MLGEVLGGRYEILESLGRGGVATVYKARDRQAGRVVALKILGCRIDPTTVRRFRREAEILAELDHPNVVKLYEVGEYDSFLVSALQYVPGSSLDHLVEEARLRGSVVPPTTALRVVLDLLAALDYIGGLELYHRDIKPANVLLDEGGRALLSDFGLAQFRDRTHLTQEGYVLGTLRYMSPEQIRGDDVDQRSDLYQVGLVLFELLHGNLPFADKNPYSQARLRTQQDLPPGRLPLDTLEHDLAEVVRRACARDRRERYGTAREMALALGAAATRRSAPVQLPAFGAPPDELLARTRTLLAARLAEPTILTGPGRRSRSSALGVVAGMALGAALGAAPFLLRPAEEPSASGLAARAREELARGGPAPAARVLLAGLEARRPYDEALMAQRRGLDDVAARVATAPVTTAVDRGRAELLTRLLGDRARLLRDDLAVLRPALTAGAAALTSSGRTSDAADLLRNAGEPAGPSPEDEAQRLLTRGKAALAAGKPERALEFLRRADQSASTFKVRRALAEAYAANGQGLFALLCAQCALAQNPTAPPMLAEACRRSLDLQVSPAPYLERLAARDPAAARELEPIGRLREDAAALVRAGRFEEALALGRAGLERLPGSVLACLALAAAQEGLGRLDDAEASCVRALRSQPFSDEAWLRLIRLEDRLGRFDRLAEAARGLLRLYPGAQHLVLLLGHALAHQGRLPELHALLDEFDGQDPSISRWLPCNEPSLAATYGPLPTRDQRVRSVRALRIAAYYAQGRWDQGLAASEAVRSAPPTGDDLGARLAWVEAETHYRLFRDALSAPADAAGTTTAAVRIYASGALVTTTPFHLPPCPEPQRTAATRLAADWKVLFDRLGGEARSAAAR